MSVETKNFDGKKVLVTGAGGGIGRALVIRLHSYGAKVFALSRRRDTLDSLAKECPGITTITVDLGNWKATEKALENLERMDVLVNNAGILKLDEFLKVTEEIVDQIFNVNVKAVMNVSQIIARKMIDEGKPGAIVNISSGTAHHPNPMVKSYCVSKSAVEMLTKVMAVELGPHKITVNTVTPAKVQTDFGLKAAADGGKQMNNDETKAWIEEGIRQTPTKAIFMPIDEILNAILFMASGMTQITGSNVKVDGGYCCS